MAEVQNRLGDFVLYPQQESLDISDSRCHEIFQDFHLSMAANYQEFSNVTSSGYEPYQAQPEYNSGDLVYYDSPQLVIDGPKEAFRPASASPSSVSHSLEHAPSNLSHTSGASAQSTASSAVGSPFSHTTQSIPVGQDQWLDSSHGLGIATGLSLDSFPPGSYHLSSAQTEHLAYHEKYPGSFVGEFHQIPLSFTAPSPLVSSPVSCSSSTSQSIASPVCSPLVAFDTSAGVRNTIDTILEEANSRIQRPSQCISSPQRSTANPQNPNLYSSSRQYEPAFKPPTRAASVLHANTLRAASPLTRYRLENGPGLQRVLGTTNSSRSPEQPKSRLVSPTSPNYSCGSRYLHDPFFTQSSGRFVAPLGSSCWFSLCHPFFLSFMWESIF